MDRKQSEYPVVTTLGSAALIPVIESGNKNITFGVLSLNLPNVGNKGITKNVVTASTTENIPLTATLIVIPASVTPYVLPNGTDGQEIKIISTGVATITPTTSLVTSISMGADSSITLLFVTTRWVPLSHHNCTLS
jgi:hypothetical protein